MAKPTAYFLTEADRDKMRRTARPITRGDPRPRSEPPVRITLWVQVESLTPSSGHYSGTYYTWSDADTDLEQFGSCWVKFLNGTTPELDIYYQMTMVDYLDLGGDKRPRFIYDDACCTNLDDLTVTNLTVTNLDVETTLDFNTVTITSTDTDWNIDTDSTFTFTGSEIYLDSNTILDLYYITTNETTTPATPAAGEGRIYEKADGKLYFINDDGTEYDLTAGAGADILVKVSSNDTTAGYLNGKLVAGQNITLTENSDGGNETLSIISADFTETNGQSALSAAFTVSSDNTWTFVDNGAGDDLSVALPAAGTYLLTGRVNFNAGLSAGTAGTMRAKLYNSTDAADVPDTVSNVVTCVGTDTYHGNWPISHILTVGGAKTIRVYAYRTGGPTWMVADVDAGSVIGYIKLDS